VIAYISGLSVVVLILRLVKSLTGGLTVRREDHVVESQKNQEEVTRLAGQRRLRVRKYRVRCIKKRVRRELIGKKLKNNKY